MSKVKSKCHFKDEWLEHEKFKCWVKKVQMIIKKLMVLIL